MRGSAHTVGRIALGSAYPPALRQWRRAKRALRTRRLRALTRQFVAWHGLKVSGGPFAGLAYPDDTATFLVPKLLGIYERELHAAVEDAIRSAPDTIVNVGAADGYYAVGLARRCPTARVHAIDTDPVQRELCARLAAANGVEVSVEATANLPAVLEGRALLVVDCEGCELGLLRPGLRDATIIVELHDFVEPGLGETVIARFADTHEVTLVHTHAQPPDRGLGLALSEYRPGPMRWAVMTPVRTRPGATARPGSS